MIDQKPALFTKILVVDDDSLSLNLIKNQLKSLGASEIDSAENGEDAYSLIKRETYSMIVQDWKLPGLSGLGLFNRIRGTSAYKLVPVLVVSGFIDKNDFKLLQEFPCTSLAEKPFTQKIIKDRLSDLSAESEWYEHHREVVKEVFQAVNHDAAKLSQIIMNVIKKSPNPIPLVLVAVKTLIQTGSLKTAQGILETLYKLRPNSAMVGHELGRVLMLRGKHSEALAVLTNADKISANNVARICLIGEAQLNLNDFENAREQFSKALAIDPEQPRAIDGFRVAQNIIEEQPNTLRMGHSFASVLNTVGIALIRNGHFQKGVDQYRSALGFLTKPVDSAKISFNLGLGYLKWGKKDLALGWFKRSESFGHGGFSKSGSYVKALVKNQPINLTKEESIESDKQIVFPEANPATSDDQISDDQKGAEPPTPTQPSVVNDDLNDLEALSTKLAGSI